MGNKHPEKLADSNQINQIVVHLFRHESGRIVSILTRIFGPGMIDAAEPAIQHLFFEEEILDHQLRMMFTCCLPSISQDSQIALTLKTLCGFSIPEIARAFLTTEENINFKMT